MLCAPVTGASEVLCTVPSRPTAPPTTAPITNRPARAMTTLPLIVRQKDPVLEQCASEASKRLGLNPPYTHNRIVENTREIKSHLPLGTS